MRKLALALVLVLAAVLPAGAQETRGNISGTVQDSQGVVPGATVKITSADTGASQQLVTNSRGYFEAPLLQAGGYQITVEMPGFKTTRNDVVLAVGQQVNVALKLEVGQISERVDVTAQTPLLDMSSVSSGQNFDSHLLANLPYTNNMPVMLGRYSVGVNPNDNQAPVSQGFASGTTTAAGAAVGGVGSTNFSLDGANNNGTNRRIATSPNSDQIQEMRIESSNFDPSVGHGLGLQIAMMTRAGTNQYRGTLNYQYWTNRLNALNVQQKATFTPSGKSLYESGRSHNFATTFGGPLVIPKVVDGRNKLFFFANYSYVNDFIPGKAQTSITVPANQAHLNGDFSDLLLLPNPAQYQIYDPLSVKVDPANSSRFIRTPFPGNIIPKARFMNADGTYKNPLAGLYAAMVPPPNQNFISPTQAPNNNYYQGGQPDAPVSNLYGGRIDYNRSANNRFFFRGSGLNFIEPVNDWTYEVPAFEGLHSWDQARYTWSFTGDWTHVAGTTVLDVNLASNQYYEAQPNPALHRYPPTSVGLPSYLDQFCGALGDCRLPLVNINGYQPMSRGAVSDDTATHIQGQVNVTSVKGSHTLRTGADVRTAQRDRGISGNTSGAFTYGNDYTRQASDTAQLTPNNLGLSLAALMLNFPTSATVTQDVKGTTFRNAFAAAYGQDSWRVNANFTVNAGLRYEYENGVSEEAGRMLVGFDEAAVLAITSAAEAAYAKAPIPQLPAADFHVRGGSLYATDPGQSGASWKGESMWMPRFSASYKVGSKTVLKGGWGLYFDTLNAADFSANQLGYSATTTNAISTDFGQTWLFGDPKNGIAPTSDPFPVRADGTRFDPQVGASLGVDAVVGSGYTSPNQTTKHARQQRWRFGVQREISANMSIEVAYNGSYSDRVSVNIRQDYLPEAYWNGSNSRDVTQQTLLNQNVTSPFNINNFTALKATNPVLYQRMSGNAFFSSTTVQRNRLLRAFPQINNLTYANLPLGEVKVHGIEMTLTRRFSNGLSGNVSFTGTRATQNRTVEEYDRAPTLWQTTNEARPYRLIASAVYELPFGPGKPWLKDGGVWAHLAGGWQTGGTFEYQPGGLVDWGTNLFFTGDMNAIAKSNPQVSLLSDGTTDLTRTWFNVDAGFEKDPAKIPATFQKRAFPFRIDGVRAYALQMFNMNFVRNFNLGGRRTFQARVDIQNLLNRQHYGNPNVDPTSTNFGRITSVNNNTMRFFTFVTRFTF